MVLLGTSVTQVFFPVASEEYKRTGDISDIVQNMFKRLVQIGVLPIMVIAILGKPLFGFVFGKEWLEAGIYAQIFSGYILLQFLCSPLSSIFNILNRQGVGLLFNILLLLGRTAALLIFLGNGGARIALASYSVYSMICYAYIFRWILQNSKVSLKWALKTFLKYFSLSLLLLPFALLAHLWGSVSIALVGVLFFSTIYVSVLLYFDISLRYSVNVFFNRVFNVNALKVR